MLVVQMDVSRLSVKRDVAPKWAWSVDAASGCHWHRLSLRVGENL